MLRKVFLIFCCLPLLLFAQKVTTFYGELEVEEPVVLELIECPSMQRLKQVHQYGVAYFSQKHPEKYTRFDHSLGVFAILRLNKRPLEEQVAGLLHDVSHTVFSHVGDWVFGKEKSAIDYQNSIHIDFLKKSEIAAILKKHGMDAERMQPLQSSFPALEAPLPDLCADRIDYNIQGAYYKHLITQEEARSFAHQIVYCDGRWVCYNLELMERIAWFALAMTQDCWGGPINSVTSTWLAEAIKRGLHIQLITLDDVHRGTDDKVWQMLVQSKDFRIQECIRAIGRAESLVQVLPGAQGADLHIRAKFRGIDPWIMREGRLLRLSKWSPSYAKEYKCVQCSMEKGSYLKRLQGCPSLR